MVAICLLYGSAHAARGAAEDIAYVVRRLREVWPNVRIHVRGESENRNKELKGGLQADRLSDHRYFANLFRLYLHTAAYHLLVRMRQQVVDPPPRDPHEPLAAEALAGRRRHQYHNRRREHDPLGQGQPCTWRTRLIKVAACVFETTRRGVVQLSCSWPYLKHFERVSQQIFTATQPSFDTS